MGAIPSDRAALGSALNDATRQVGAALGVAVQGSLLATVYTTRLTSRLAELHVAVPAAQRSLLGTATADRLPPGTGTVVADAARDAFVAGMDLAASVAAVVTLVTAAATACWLRHR